MFNNIKSTPKSRTDMLSNVYCLYGEINDERAQEIAEWILFNNFLSDDEKPDALTLIINSGGGSLSAGFSIVDFMLTSDIPVHTIGTGIVASAGALILMSGDVGNRVLSRNCSIMMHQFIASSDDGYGAKMHELVAIQKEFDNTQERLVLHIMKHTKLNRKIVNTKLMNKSDIWLTPNEAVKLGLADSVNELNKS